MPEMLRTIVEDLLSLEEDIVVVGCSEHRGGVLQEARAEGADMLITQSGQESKDASLDAILSAAPVKIFAIGADGREAAVVDLTRCAVTIEGDGHTLLGQAIRETAHSFHPSSVRGARWLG